ncbi:MAG: GNAT family N-acetyltransferase [Armatimonadetes bacterium]|nr:GNAT family N-acetyltransferase [Armatimonadota bacterium]
MHFYLKEMCVATEYQRKGIGTASMESLERDLADQGVGKIIFVPALREQPGGGVSAGEGILRLPA